MDEAILTATFLCNWLSVLADKRNTSVPALAAELGTARALALEIARYIASEGRKEAARLFYGKQDPPTITPTSSLMDRVCASEYVRIKQRELDRLEAEAHAQLTQRIHGATEEEL